MAHEKLEVPAWITEYHAERRKWYPVTKQGVRIHEGDEIVTFRGETLTFGGVTAAPDGPSEGKISAKFTDGDRVSSREFYPTVFGLTLVREHDTEEQGR